jgi:Uma2 family endonuclease
MGPVTTLPYGGRFTRADLEAMPDDGRRHELVDGTLVVTPSPSHRHQRCSLRLAVLLHEECPGDLEVVAAPFDIALAEDTIMQPDLLVARRKDFTDKDLSGVPVLVIEILSASTRQVDLHLKRARYEAAGCPSYWIVDPEAPSIVVLELENGRYVERARALGSEEIEVSLPYELTVKPQDLVT